MKPRSPSSANSATYAPVSTATSTTGGSSQLVPKLPGILPPVTSTVTSQKVGGKVGKIEKFSATSSLAIGIYIAVGLVAIVGLAILISQLKKGSVAK
jgi:hypothetical protein